MLQLITAIILTAILQVATQQFGGGFGGQQGFGGQPGGFGAPAPGQQSGISTECPPGTPPGANAHCVQAYGSISTADLPDILPDSKNDTHALLDIPRALSCLEMVRPISKSIFHLSCLACECRNFSGFCGPRFICSYILGQYNKTEIPHSDPGAWK